MKRISILISSAALLALPFVTSAATFKGGETFDLGIAETVDGNLYAGGGMSSLAGTVHGDAFVGGGNITVTGTVDDDLAVGGGSITLLGAVGGDLRAAGGSITVGSMVGNELLVAGGNISILPQTQIAGDATAAGGAMTLAGSYGGDLAVYGGEVRIDGTVEGDLHVESENLTLGPSALIKGSLSHVGPKAAVLEAGAVVQGENMFTLKEVSEKHIRDAKDLPLKGIGKAIAGAFFMLVLMKFLAFLIAALAATYWYRRTSQAVVEQTLGNFGMDLLVGLVAMVVTPVIVVLLFVSMIGWLFAVMLIAFMTLVTFIAGIYAVVSFGALLMKLFTKSKHYEADWKSALLGAVLLTAVMLVPVIGWLAGCAFYVASLGALLRLCYGKCCTDCCGGKC